MIQENIYMREKSWESLDVANFLTQLISWKIALH